MFQMSLSVCVCVCCAFYYQFGSCVVVVYHVQGGKYTEQLTRGKSGKVSSLLVFSVRVASLLLSLAQRRQGAAAQWESKKKGTRVGSIDNFIILGKMSLNSQNDAAHDNNSNNITKNLRRKKNCFSFVSP